MECVIATSPNDVVIETLIKRVTYSGVFIFLAPRVWFIAGGICHSFFGQTVLNHVDYHRAMDSAEILPELGQHIDKVIESAGDLPPKAFFKAILWNWKDLQSQSPKQMARAKFYIHAGGRRLLAIGSIAVKVLVTYKNDSRSDRFAKTFKRTDMTPVAEFWQLLFKRLLSRDLLLEEAFNLADICNDPLASHWLKEYGSKSAFFKHTEIEWTRHSSMKPDELVWMLEEVTKMLADGEGRIEVQGRPSFVATATVLQLFGLAAFHKDLSGPEIHLSASSRSIGSGDVRVIYERRHPIMEEAIPRYKDTVRFLSTRPPPVPTTPQPATPPTGPSAIPAPLQRSTPTAVKPFVLARAQYPLRKSVYDAGLDVPSESAVSSASDPTWETAGRRSRRGRPSWPQSTNYTNAPDSAESSRSAATRNRIVRTGSTAAHEQRKPAGQRTGKVQELTEPLAGWPGVSNSRALTSRAKGPAPITFPLRKMSAPPTPAPSKRSPERSMPSPFPSVTNPTFAATARASVPSETQAAATGTVIIEPTPRFGGRLLRLMSPRDGPGPSSSPIPGSRFQRTPQPSVSRRPSVNTRQSTRESTPPVIRHRGSGAA